MACGVVKYLHPTTAIYSAVYCNFYNKLEKSLVVSGLNFVQVYRINTAASTSYPSGSPNQPQPPVSSHVSTNIMDEDDEIYGPSSKSIEIPSSNLPAAAEHSSALIPPESLRFECLATYELYGTIVDIKAASLPNGNRDLILLTFADARLSVVQYDPIVNDLRTVSLHDYEASKFSDEMPTNLFRADPIVRVDPDNRCGAMRVYRSQLAIIPFLQPPVRSENAYNGPRPSSQLKSFVISLKKIKEDHVEMIQDFQFLPGYLEPTVAVLCHRNTVWAGRIAVNTDTCYVAALSINTREKTYHVIWTCMGLPFDSLYIRNIPRPVDGLLLATTGALVYVNQGASTHGVSLNSCFMGVPRFPMKTERNLVASLDGSDCLFLEPERALLTLRNGSCYVVTIVYDQAARIVRDFHFQQVLTNNYTSCLTMLEGGFVFLGGKMADSVLYSFSTTEWIEATGVETESGKDDQAKRTPSPTKFTTEKEDEEIYGTSALVTNLTPLKKVHFVKCDSIPNLGPCRTSALGEPMNILEDIPNPFHRDADLVVSSGIDNESYVAALHRSIRPEVMASFDLPGIRDVWTLKAEDGEYHSVVVASTETRTVVFQCGEDIVEAEDHPFVSEEKTVACFQAGEGVVSFQVTKKNIRISKPSGAEQVILPLEDEEDVIFATENNGLFALLTSSSKMVVLRWEDSAESLDELDSSKLINRDNPPIAVSVYTDISGLFTTIKPSGIPIEAEVFSTEPETVADVIVRQESHQEMDEDELLYGSHANISSHGQKEKQERTKTEFLNHIAGERLKQQVVEASQWLVIVRKDHSVVIYDAATFDEKFETPPVIHAPRVIHDCTAFETGTLSAPLEIIKEASQDLRIREIHVTAFGLRASHPYVFLAINDDVYIYQVIPFYHGSSDSRLRIALSRVKHDMLTRPRIMKKKLARQSSIESEAEATFGRCIRPFRNIQGYSGVFLCFPYPFMVMISERNILRCHPLTVDGPIRAFAEFSNANCNAGFIYFNNRQQIRVAALESFWDYDSHWPVKKVKAPGVVHFLAYHLECKAYVLCSALDKPEKRMAHGGVDQVDLEVAERDERFVYPSLPHFSIHLLNPDGWHIVPETSYELQEFEHVTSMKVVALRNGTETGMKEYIAISTNHSYGEDVQSRGRIILLDVSDINPDPEQPQTTLKLKEVYAEEQKGPVTAIAGVNGYIISAIGQKIFLWSLKGTSLVGMAFLDVQIYVHQLTSIKDLILVTDVQRSISICRFQENYRTLSLVSTDPNQMHTYGAEFCVDGQTLSAAVTDIRQDLHIFQFDPNYYFSAFGNRLVRRMESNLGQYVTNMFRMRCAAWYPDVERVAHIALTKKHLTMFVTLEGGVGCFMSIPERTYRRILMIETILSNHCVHRAGLSPRLYWSAKLAPDQRFDLVGNIKTIADAKVGSLYMELDQTEKYEVATKIGCSVDALIEELLDIDRQTAVL